MALIYILWIIMILVPIIGVISLFITCDKKGYKEIDVFIHHKNND